MTVPTFIPPDFESKFRGMNRAMALVLLEECYDKVTAENAPFSAKLDLLKLNVKLGELEPKQVLTPVGNNIQFVINLPQMPGMAAETITIEGNDGFFESEPPPRPEYLPDYSLVLVP
jgi:hypothetical protein